MRDSGRCQRQSGQAVLNKLTTTQSMAVYVLSLGVVSSSGCVR